MNFRVTNQAAQLLAEYSADHQNLFNRLMHSICVPLIAIALIGLLWAIPVPGTWSLASTWINFGTAALIILNVYYLRLAPRLGLGMVVAALLVAPLLAFAAGLPVPLWLTALVVFTVGWIGQFIGHYVEGRRPSFFRDLRFLLIGPLWVLAKFYAVLGIRA
ncbi:MAG: DUF962 domain-containing protein [Chromatiales bacterium]|jgi:uncharacterized membrane protein YGL010W|nr:MAG: DUF962 domain-containing protein [Chromatiales bacterium]